MIEHNNENNKEFNIPLILGEETRPKIELFEDNNYSVYIKNSIFYKQYCIALASIAELIIYNSRDKKEEQQYLHNNIFLFTGERGSGKTSCMLTVKELLCNNERKQERYYNIDINPELKKILIWNSFQSFETIDPIFFDHRHNILDLFIGTLFKSFREYENNPKGNDSSSSRRELQREQLLNEFADTKRNLSILNKEITLSEFDDLEQLNDLAASINFRNSIQQLVKNYIKYVNNTDQLILCIDDIDLNMSEGYEMIEQIRKYLNIPGLIILMAIKIEQLANVIRIKYSNDFLPLLKLKNEKCENKKNYDEVINEIVERYITKLFPLSQRIQLPSVSDLLNQSIGIFEYEKENKPVYKSTLNPLKEGLLYLIYKKIRLLAYNTTQQIHYIIPRNLRELLNLIHLLYSMDDARNHKEAIPNLSRFKDYFYGSWCTNNLAEDDLAFMRNALNVINADIINQMMIKFLKKRFTSLNDLESSEDRDNSIKELTNILNKENIMYNISLGDVLACLDWLEKIDSQEKDLKLLFAIKIYYSISLYENFRNKEEVIEEAKKREEKEIINRERLTNNETSYGNIINGNFFNSEYLNVAPYESGETSRCRRIINSKKIIQLGKEEKEESKKIAEFFMLTTSFVLDAKEYEKDNKDKGKNNIEFSYYRKKREVYYEKKITAARNYVCFDVLSIFYNLLDITKTYSRYGLNIKGIKALPENDKKSIGKRINDKYKDILDKTLIAKKIEEAEETESQLLFITQNYPLYKAILDNVEIKEDKDYEYIPFYKKEKVLLYTLNIRNIELLEQISYSLQKERPDGSSDNIALLKSIFKTLSEYKIKTYNNHDINYSFFKAISEFLNNLEEKKEDFNAIYSDIFQNKPEGNSPKNNS